MDSPLKVIVEAVPNSEMHIVHVKARISDYFFTHSLTGSIDTYSNPGPIAEAIVRKCLNIAGITEVSVRPYDFTVSKAKTFDWEELVPKLLDVVREALNVGELEVSHTKLEIPPHRRELDESPASFA